MRLLRSSWLIGKSVRVRSHRGVDRPCRRFPGRIHKRAGQLPDVAHSATYGFGTISHGIVVVMFPGYVKTFGVVGFV